jgi:hypothetical protein
VPGVLGMEEMAMITQTLTWPRQGGDTALIKSNAGHTITGVRNAAGKVLYNAWTQEPHKSKHLEQGYEADGLARCKTACEQHHADSGQRREGE